MELYKDIFIKSLSLYSADIAQDRRCNEHTFTENRNRTNLSFLEFTNILRNRPYFEKDPFLEFTNILQNRSSFMHALQKNYCSFDSLITELFFLVIFDILLSRLSYFHLVFRLTFTYTSWGDSNFMVDGKWNRYIYTYPRMFSRSREKVH